MDTPDFFVGARLGGARLKAGISLEKAARDTRIRVQRLREIEADDFSGFAHPTYSRLFLLDYAEYLGVSQDEIRPLLPDRAGAAGGGFEYINALARNPSSPVVLRQYRRPNLLKIFLAAGLFLILVVAGFFVYSTIKKIERVAGSTSHTAKPPPSLPATLPTTPADEAVAEPSARKAPEESATPKPPSAAEASPPSPPPPLP